MRRSSPALAPDRRGVGCSEGSETAGRRLLRGQRDEARRTRVGCPWSCETQSRPENHDQKIFGNYI